MYGACACPRGCDQIVKQTVAAAVDRVAGSAVEEVVEVVEAEADAETARTAAVVAKAAVAVVEVAVAVEDAVAATTNSLPGAGAANCAVL